MSSGPIILLDAMSVSYFDTVVSSPPPLSPESWVSKHGVHRKEDICPFFLAFSQPIHISWKEKRKRLTTKSSTSWLCDSGWHQGYKRRRRLVLVLVVAVVIWFIQSRCFVSQQVQIMSSMRLVKKVVHHLNSFSALFDYFPPFAYYLWDSVVPM